MFKRRPRSGPGLRPGESVVRRAPDSTIPYHPDLVDRLKEQHAAVLKAFETVKGSAIVDDFEAAAKSLQVLRHVLTSHLLEENVKLYTYLRKCLASDWNNKRLILRMKSEMDDIGSRVMKFLDDYDRMGVTSATKKQFLEDLNHTGNLLKQRVENEESVLFTMYMPPNMF